MADFKFKVVYTEDPDKITPALDAGVVDEGDLIIVNDDGIGSMKFVTNTKELIGMDATITEEQKQAIVDDTVAKVEDQVITKSDDLIFDGNTSLLEEVGLNG